MKRTALSWTLFAAVLLAAAYSCNLKVPAAAAQAGTPKPPRAHARRSAPLPAEPASVPTTPKAPTDPPAADERQVLAPTETEALQLEVAQLKAQLAEQRVRGVKDAYTAAMNVEAAPLRQAAQDAGKEFNATAERIRAAHGWGADVRFAPQQREYYREPRPAGEVKPADAQTSATPEQKP